MSAKAVLAQAPESIRFDTGSHPDSCGALRTLEVIGEIEARAGKPAICSNQAMIWDCLRLAGIEDRFEGYGRLLEEFQ